MRRLWPRNRTNDGLVLITGCRKSLVAGSGQTGLIWFLSLNRQAPRRGRTPNGGRRRGGRGVGWDRTSQTCATAAVACRCSPKSGWRALGARNRTSQTCATGGVACRCSPKWAAAGRAWGWGEGSHVTDVRHNRRAARAGCDAAARLCGPCYPGIFFLRAHPVWAYIQLSLRQLRARLTSMWLAVGESGGSACWLRE